MKRLAAIALLLFAAFVMCGVFVEAQTQQQVPWTPQSETTDQILRAIDMANHNPQPPPQPRGPSNKQLEKDRNEAIGYRFAYCQQNPNGFVDVPLEGRVACTEELARIKAYCTVKDPKFKKLQYCKAFVKK